MKRNIHEKGITLIALVITIIVLVILAAVTLNSIFGNNIIGIAINGAKDYAEEQQKELGMLNNVSGILSDFLGDSNKPMAPSVTLEGTKGNTDIYISDVTANISINRGLEEAGTIKLHYSLSGAKTQEEQVIEEDISIQITEEGTTTITAWAENDKGNLSDKVEITFTINKTAPSTPTIALSGTNGENGYYISDVGVTISAGETANVASIKYKVEDANPIAETESAGNGDVTFDITQDGKSTVTAYIINTAGLTSETITETVNKDSTAPSTATIALSGEAGRTTIDVTATGADVTSGVGSYIFQISTTGNEDDFQSTDTVTNTANSCTYQYDELTAGTTYYLRVIVKDKAGNTAISNVVEQYIEKKEINIGELTEEEKNGMVGKYIDYTPVSGTFSDHVGDTYSGSSSNSQMSTITSLKWKIFEVTNSTLTLISDTTANENLYLFGADGYNNGVLLLNNACKAMYSNSSLGATARSLKLEDIGTKSSERMNDWGDFTISGSSDPHFPWICVQEKTVGINNKWGTLGVSEQDQYYTGERIASVNVITTNTLAYSYSLEERYMSSTYVELFRYQPGTKTNLTNSYWIATRGSGFDYDETRIYFSVYRVSGDSAADDSLYVTLEGERWSRCNAIRPVVEIDLSKVIISGDNETGYSIEPKT